MKVTCLYCIASLLVTVDLTSAALRTAISSKRDLQQENSGAQETCGWSPMWRFENDPLYARKNPIVPCTRHGECSGFSAKGIDARWPPCCLNRDCICGSTRVLFQTGSLSCGRFACSNDGDCTPGLCRNGACNFDNIQPECRTAADCGGGVNVCHEGLCHVRDEVTGFILLVKNKGKSNKGGSGGSFSEAGSGGKKSKKDKGKKEKDKGKKEKDKGKKEKKGKI